MKEDHNDRWGRFERETEQAEKEFREEFSKRMLENHRQVEVIMEELQEKLRKRFAEIRKHLSESQS